MSFRQYLKRLRQSVNRVRPGQRPHKFRRRPQLECLEDRLVPSSVTWTNRGQDSDNFGTVFGSNAALARSVVDEAITEWTSVITNFNQDNGGNNIDVTISMNTAAGSSGGSTGVDTTDSQGRPTRAHITLGRTGDRTNPWYLDPNPFSTAFTATNAFAGSAGPTSPANGQADLLYVVTHELGHAMGFSSNA